jgi:predicted transcriptional regulator
MGDSDISVNTIQSTLERLVRKSLLTRQKQARAYLYSAAVSRATLISSLLRDIRRDVAGGEMVPMVSGFAEFLAEDGDLLQREHSDE